MIKTKITMAIILILVVGMIVNSGGIAISNVQATTDEGDKTQSSNEMPNPPITVLFKLLVMNYHRLMTIIRHKLLTTPMR